ncbi:unnamed protein product [Closterium sp. NIES-65]|nr:unnamed protein product [Closterium sp. NIES-65]
MLSRTSLKQAKKKKPPRPPPNPNDYLLKFKPITPTPPKTWPDNLILTLATGEASKNLTVLLRSFQRFVEHGGRAWLILFFDRVPLWWWPMTAEQRKGIYMQQYEAPRAGGEGRVFEVYYRSFSIPSAWD